MYLSTPRFSESTSLLKTPLLLSHEYVTEYVAILAGKHEFLKNCGISDHVVIGHKI